MLQAAVICLVDGKVEISWVRFRLRGECMGWAGAPGAQGEGSDA